MISTLHTGSKKSSGFDGSRQLSKQASILVLSTWVVQGYKHISGFTNILFASIISYLRVRSLFVKFSTSTVEKHEGLDDQSALAFSTWDGQIGLKVPENPDTHGPGEETTGHS